MIFSVTALGTSSAIPNSKRYTSSHLVNIHERLFLIDCGEGTQIQLRRNRVRISRVNHIFISHLHGDHIYGLFGLLSTFNLLGRTHPIHLYANPKLKDLLHYHDNFFQQENNFEIIFHDIEPTFEGVIYQDDRITVETFKLDHSVPSHGFIFKEKTRLRKINKNKLKEYNIPISEINNLKKGCDYLTENNIRIPNNKLTTNPPLSRSYAYCSDTAYKPEIVAFIKNVDLLYHEATFSETDKNRAKSTKHSTSTQAAEIAKQAKVKKLIIGHFSARYKNLDLLLNEAKEVFPNTYLAEERKIYEIEES